ncbi:hypothetical protein [Wolbachia endosymbiont of Psylliodes chrysocephala]|uniref:hypothetical protein n=1 Tax=Wolbachia endosymbiont of Psylliodes chrysocephala TaxID=2883236 RepID=UPI0020A0FC71|nr:hypothetical protein [Wolbachia endosymbiont of Psylliodes chrysocephala]
MENNKGYKGCLHRAIRYFVNLQAVSNCDVDKVKSLIENGQRMQPLHKAIMLENIPIVTVQSFL